MFEITSNIVKTDVTCVNSFQNYILAGIGSNLYIFSQKGALLQIYSALQGQKIHGIIPNSTNKLVVFGGNVIKTMEFDFVNSVISKDITVRQCDDWIYDVKWIDSDSQLVTIFAKNYVSLWTASEIKLEKNVGCEEKCTLYSAFLINDTWDELFVLSGTVFGQILIWRPAENPCLSPVIYRLRGHDGAIFSIAYSKQHNTIVTTSDDRTVRLWASSENFFTKDYYKNPYQIISKRIMYGHVARVFRCIIIENLIVTGGEDSFVHIWNFEGEIIRKFETHQGGCVWALAYCDKRDLIVTGGGDTGVSLYPLELDKKIDVLPNIEGNAPRSLRLTAAGNVAVIMYNGWLRYYITDSKTWVNITLHQDLKNYAILEISESRELVAVAGLNGIIHIYKEKDNNLKKLCSSPTSDSNRIFTLYWLAATILLKSSVDGEINLLCLEKYERKYDIIIKQKYILPPCKERWATCATFCFEQSLAVGDRKGNIHLYNVKTQECLQTIKKAHCHLGVTALKFTASNELISLGRNGFLNKYRINSSNQLFQTTSDKLPFSWLTSIINQNNLNILSGFSGSDFIIYNLDQRRIILSFNCGGGHRSWDVLINKSNIFNFYFIREKKLNTFTQKMSHILSFDLVFGYHTKEINCGTFITLPDEENKLLFVSGGEDTTLRLSFVNFSVKLRKFDTVQTLKTHLSSVRCVAICPLENNEYLLFSGGGRAQIILHKLQPFYSDNKFLKIECQQLHSYYKQPNNNEAETRIMDLITINLGKTILLIAGCSDGNLKYYVVEMTENFTLKFLCDISYAAKCIIKLSYIKIHGRHVVVSMATDGKLVFWNLTDFCDKFEGHLKPFYHLKVHQSGINSFSYHKLEDEIYIFATGGDDNSIVLNVVGFFATGNTLDAIRISKWINSNTHGAQVTGIFIFDEYLITASVDQHIYVFKYKLEDAIKCEYVKHHCSSVSDIQGMQCVLLNDKIYAAIFGKGVEVFTFHFSK